MRKRWIFIPLAVVALALGITGGAVLAQSDDPDNDSRAGKFAARVASILTLEASQVEDAMKQARTELRQEGLQDKLDSMVESGKITQEQADEFKTWVEARPEGAFMGFKPRNIDTEDLDALVESGRITQQQADSHTDHAEWLESRPEGILDGFKGRGFKGRWGHHGGGYDRDSCQDEDGSPETAVAAHQA